MISVNTVLPMTDTIVRIEEYEPLFCGSTKDINQFTFGGEHTLLIAFAKTITAKNSNPVFLPTPKIGMR
jgi:hypothetical protein